MSAGDAGIVRAGARLLWRRQRSLWWIYGVNLLLGLLATLPMALRTGGVLDSSLAAERLLKGFDLALFFEVAAHPDVALRAQLPASLLSLSVFFVYVLFLTGGLLEDFRRVQRQTTAEFFHSCGLYFWRFTRLLLFLLVALVLLGILAGLGRRWTGRLASDAPQEMLGFWVEVGGAVLLLLLLMAVRFWFDMAQIRAVAEDERAMRRTVWRALKLTLGNFFPLFWIYLRISLLAWAGLVAIAWVWVRWVRPESIGVSFLLGQALVLLWLGTRLWQRAAETLWYQRQPARVPAPLPESQPPQPGEQLTPGL